MNLSRLSAVCMLLGCSTLLLGCNGDPKATLPHQDPEEAKKLLVGRWEGEWVGVPRGFEFKQSGEASYLTCKKGLRDSKDGKPVKFNGTFAIPNPNRLKVHYQVEGGFREDEYIFRVTERELIFDKDGTNPTRLRRVEQFSMALTGAE